MKRCFTGVMLLVPGLLVAQHDTVSKLPSSSISGYAGTAVSLRNIIKPSSLNEWMDYMQPGFCTGVAGQLPLFKSHFGLRASFNFYRNGFDMNKFIKQQNNLIDMASTTSVDYGAFTQYDLLLGAFYSTVIKKLTVQLWAMPGCAYVSLPNTEVNIVVPPPSQSAYTSTVIYKDGLAFALESGVSIQYRVANKLSVCGTVGFTNVFRNYTSIRYDDYVQHINYVYTGSGSYQAFMEELTLGFVYNFDNLKN